MVQTADDVILGWDSLLVCGTEKVEMVATKIWAQDGIIYGVAGMTRTADAIQALTFPVYPGGDPRQWIIKEWTPVLREAVKDDTLMFNSDEGVMESFALLMVVGGQAFDLDSTLSPTQNTRGIYTAGTGGKYARGVLLAGGTVMDALEVAEESDVYTGGTLTAKSAKALLDEEFTTDTKYRISVERANQPHKKWGFVVDYKGIDKPKEFEEGLGMLVLSALKADQEFLHGA